MSDRDEQIKKLAEEPRIAGWNRRELGTAILMGQVGPSLRNQLLDAAFSSTEKDEEIARLTKEIEKIAELQTADKLHKLYCNGDRAAQVGTPGIGCICESPATKNKLIALRAEIARLKEKLGIAEGALEEIAGDVYQPTDFAHVSTAREALSALAAIREKAPHECNSDDLGYGEVPCSICGREKGTE